MAIFALGSCERRDLEIYYTPVCKVIVNVDWRDFLEVPTGMTMYFFRENNEAPITITTSSVYSAEVNLPVGKYKMYLINQSVGEFGTIGFDDMNKYDSAKTFLEVANNSWYTPTKSEQVVVNPENIGVAIAEPFEITQSMVDDYQKKYEVWKTKVLAYENASGTKSGDSGAGEITELSKFESELASSVYVIDTKAQNVISQLNVRIYAKNADVLRTVRSSVSGMASTFELTKFTTDKGIATQLLESWTLQMDNLGTRVGHVEATITTFGLPEGVDITAGRDSTLNVSCLLVDNKTVADYIFDVGDKIKVKQGKRGYRRYYELVIGTKEKPAISLPDVKPPPGGGGFKATVQDWEDTIEADISI